ncbi:MAG: PLD nuclease N-terminal domain-containing protein [Nocardioides sp.]
MAKKKWSDYSPAQQRAVCVASAVEVVMTAAALRDLARRPSDDVRGPKRAWALALFVQPVGPIAYFALGRRQA